MVHFFLVPCMQTVTLVIAGIRCINALPSLHLDERSVPRVSTIWEFTNNTWVENLAVRPNGQILATIVTRPELYLVDPTKAHPAILIHTFPGADGLTGIVEDPPGSDIYYVGAGNLSFAQFATIRGSWSVWRVNMTTFQRDVHDATVSKLTDLPSSFALVNGMTALDGRNILVADSGGGVFRVNIETGHATEVLTGSLFEPVPLNASLPLGVNGIELRNEALYWTNSNQDLLAYVPIHEDGTRAGKATVLTSNFTGADDFAITSNGIIAAGDNELRRVALGTGAVTVISNSTLLEGSTAVRVASGREDRGNNVFYVSTNGGVVQYLVQEFTNPGKVLRVDLRGRHYGW